MDDWSNCTLGDVLELKRGYDLPHRDRREGQYPIVSSSGVSGTHKAFKADAPGVVTGRYGTIGEVYFIEKPFWPLNTSLYVRDFKGNDPRFISYFLRTIDYYAYSDKAAVPGVNRNHLHLASVVVPPIEEQRAIASVLGSLDDKIELNRRMNRTLEQMAAAIFKAWFVDFEPVRAKASGAASFPGMPQPVFDALPATFADSELGPIPEGWEAQRLPDIIEVNPKRTLKKGEPAPHLDMKNMPTQGHAPEAWGERSFGSGMKFINGDTLVARITPCLENGKTAFVDFLEDGLVGWGSTEYIVLRPKPPLPEVYAYCLARTGDFRDFAIQNMTGTSGRQRVPATALDHYPLVRPDETTAKAFGEIVEPLFTLIRSNMDESRSLAETRDALLPKLLSGEVRASIDADDSATSVPQQEDAACV